MSDTTTITAEERALWASLATARINAVTPERQCEITAQERLVKALNALEQAEARAENAEAEKTTLEEDMEATEKSLKEYSGFFEELCARLKERFPKQYADLEGDEYGEDAFGVHELFEHVIDPVIEGAKEQAEANVARLTEERDWLADKCAMHCHDKDRDDILCSDDACDISSLTCVGASACEWKEAARRAVADAESEVKPCQK